MTTDLRSLMINADAVLFDFDGPLCDVFAGSPAWRIARSLEELAGEEYGTDDPLEVLRLSARKSPELLSRVESALVSAELSAVAVSRATIGGIDSMRACLVSHRVGVVSNNSRAAVVSFLESRHMLDVMSVVVGRQPRKPWLMKPNPWPVQAALERLGTPGRSVVYVGDSDTDIEVARITGMPSVAYANKPGKRKKFEALGATVVIDTMSEIAAALV